MVINMIIKANKEELKTISNDLLKSSSSVYKEIEIWEKSIEKLKSIWQGKDASIFYSKIDNYLIKLKMLSESSSAIGNFINNANNKYIEKDKEFTELLKRENENNESRNEQDSNY